MTRDSIRLVCVAIFYMGLTYGSRRSDLFMSHVVDMVHDPPSPLFLGILTTEDGYIISMQNIPGGPPVKGTEGGRRQPVLLQHRILMDGMTWLLDNPDESLGYILADNGFDVWIANTRGTRCSLKHQSLHPTKPAYWDWSWDELVQYVLPSIVGFVHQQTGQKMHFVGHSLGTLIALASFSEGKQVDKLKFAALLSPIAYLSHMTTIISQLAAEVFIGEIMSDLLGIPEFNPKEKAVDDILNNYCSQPGINCYHLLTSITGKDCCLNSSTVDLFLRYEPQPSSTKTMVHLAQVVRNGVIAKFDYVSPEANMVHYSQSKPPVYNLSKIPSDLPLFLSYGGEDALSDVNDVQLLLYCLKFQDGDKLTVQYVKDFAHANFVVGVTTKSIVYDEMIKFFNCQ